MKIGIIIGSTRPGRAGEPIARWYLDQIKNIEDAQYELIDLEEINLPLLDEPKSPASGEYRNPHTRQWSDKVAGCDGFVWVTAEYNHSVPAALKNALDYVYHEWARKPVAIVSYGSMGGVRAAEHLRQIAGELQMVDIRPNVMIREPWAAFNDDGTVRNDVVFGDPKTQMEELLWWTKLLKEAKVDA